MSFAPYLGFPGTCREAMTDYARIFGASDLQIMTYAEAPEGQRPPGDPSRVMHSQLSAGPGGPLMAADMPEGMGTAAATAVFHAAPSLDRARAVFAALAEGGAVQMPLGPTFWSEGFGMLTDRWGTGWLISVAGPAGTEGTTATTEGAEAESEAHPT